MTTALIVSPPKDISTQPSWTPEQIALVKRTICKGATDDQMKLFMHICQRTGLDPFARQIYATFRKDKRTQEIVMTVQTGIDGFRLTASRTGVYAGRDEASFEYKNDKPDKCKVTVYKIVAGVRCAWTATAKWSEYYPGDDLGFMWKKLPETMLEKCCEAKALRMAFPAELSGIYGKEEMDQADTQIPVIGNNLVRPDEPGPEDGVQKQSNAMFIKYGRFAGQYVDHIDPWALREEIQKQEKLAEKDGKKLSPFWERVAEAATPYIAAAEAELESDV